jgi:hypothetical protein
MQSFGAPPVHMIKLTETRDHALRLGASRQGAVSRPIQTKSASSGSSSHSSICAEAMARLRAALGCAIVARSSIALWPVAHNYSLLGQRDRVSVADELPT